LPRAQSELLADRGDVWVLHLVAAPGFGPTTTAQRVRRALKVLGRGFGLRCVNVGGWLAQEEEDVALYDQRLQAMTEAELRQECVNQFSLWLDLDRQARDRPHPADRCLMECERRGVVEAVWRPAIAEARERRAAERKQ
jgi:hypothetical protein